MHIETSKKTVAKSNKEVFEFLTDLKNFELLMPDNISKFELINEDSYVFALKGMPEIILERKSQQANDNIVLGAAGGKLPFTLTANIAAIEANSCEVVLSFEGEFNAMMAMMIKKPIKNLMDTLSQNLDRI